MNKNLIEIQENNWIVFTHLHVFQYLRKEQVDLINTNNDPATNIIKDVVRRIRIEIATNKNNVSDPTTPWSLPPELITVAAHLVIECLFTRIPTLKLSPDQIRNADNARKFLERVANGKVIVSTPFKRTLVDTTPDRLFTRKRSATHFNLRGL